MRRSIRLRPWQRAALDKFADTPGSDFLAVATPGAGKTTFALAAARQVLAGSRARLVVVVPTAHLKRQWERAAAELDLHLDAGWSPSRDPLAADMHGVVVTYQQVVTAAGPLASLARGAFVVLDEIHHAGDDRAWGEALREAFGGAQRRLSLSGTPFRSDTRAIPFVHYEMEEARPDYEYGYGQALEDRRVVRPVYFPRTNGYMEWSAPDGQLHAATFDDPLDVARANQRLRTALSVEGRWLPEVLEAAHARLCEVRASQPDAGGLVIAMDQEHAHAVAALMERELRTRPVVATSDDSGASAAIAEFGRTSTPWLVAVRMVSEGVDIPRLRVGVFATTTTTELFFRQAVGRFVRWVPGAGRQAAYVFIPDDARLRRGAAAIAEARRHSLHRDRAHTAEGAVADDAGVLEPGCTDGLAVLEGEDEQLSLFSVISAVATDAVDADGDGVDEPLAADDDPSLELELGAPPPLLSHLGARGRLAAEDQTGDSGAWGQAAPDVAGSSGVAVVTRAERKQQLRLANSEVARLLARRTGWSHAQVNAELNRLCGLAKVTQATLDQLESRLRHGQRWLERTTSRV